MLSRNHLQSGGFITFTTSFMVITIGMSSNITDKQPPIEQLSICLQ